MCRKRIITIFALTPVSCRPGVSISPVSPDVLSATPTAPAQPDNDTTDAIAVSDVPVDAATETAAPPLVFYEKKLPADYQKRLDEDHGWSRPNETSYAFYQTACAEGHLAFCRRMAAVFRDDLRYGFIERPVELYTDDYREYPAFRQVAAATHLEALTPVSVHLTALAGAQLLILRKSPPPHADSVEALVDVIQPDDPPNRSILVRLPESALTALAPKFPLAPLSETEQAALLASSRRVEPFADPSSADAERFVVFNASGGLRAQPFRADEKAAAGTGYVSIHCGALEVYFAPQTVAGHRWYPVRQIVEGIQMAGWTRGAVHWTRGGNVCRHPLARDLFFNGRPLPLPAGYVPFDEKKSRQYARILRNSRRLYFLNNEGGCYSMRLEKGKLLRTEVDVHDDGSRTRTVNAFGFEVGDSGVWQTGPGGESITYDRDGNVVGRSGWGFGTSTYYAVVGGNRHEIHLIEVGTAASISGYHPDSTQSWFLSRASCEAHLETNPRRRIDETRPIELGVRTDAAL